MKTALLLILLLGRIYGGHSSNQNETIKTIALSRSEELKEVVAGKRVSEHEGWVSWYSSDYCEKYNPECKTASGEVFDETKLTCACDNRFNLGDRLRVTYKNKSVEIVCNDRGNFKKYGVTLDLAKAAFQSLASTEAGKIKVKIEKIEQK